MARTLVSRVDKKLLEIEEVEGTDVNLVWEPRWTPERMSKEAREKLGFGTDSQEGDWFKSRP